jgi:hypothetical protein
MPTDPGRYVETPGGPGLWRRGGNGPDSDRGTLGRRLSENRCVDPLI